MNRKLAVGGMLILIHIAVGWYLACRHAATETASRIDRMRSVLQETAEQSDREKAFGKAARDVFASVLGLPASDTARIREQWDAGMMMFPPDLGSLVLFDENDHPVCSFPPASCSDTLLEELFRYLQGSYLGKNSSDNAAMGSYAKFFQSQNWINLISRPNRLVQIGSPSDLRWVWWERRVVKSSVHSIAGGILLFRAGHHSADDLLNRRHAMLLKQGMEFGILDRIRLQKSRPLTGMSSEALASAAEQFFRAPSDVIPLGDSFAVVVSCLDHLLLFGRVRPSVPVFSGWVWVLLLAWCPWFFLRIGSEAGFAGRVPLWGLVFFLVFIAAGLPLLLSAFLWLHLEQTRTESISSEALTELKERLVRIDLRFPTIRRRLRAEFRSWACRFERAWLDASHSGVFEPDSREPKTLYQARPDTRLAGLIDETRDWEMQGRLDTCYIVASAGFLLREATESPLVSRRLALLAKDQRMKLLDALYERDGFEYFGKFKLVFSSPPAGASRKAFLTNDALVTTTTNKLFVQLGGSIINQYNAWKGVGGAGTREAASTMVLQNMLDEQGGNPVHRFLSKTRDFAFFGEGDSAGLYIDVIHGGHGGAEILLAILCRTGLFSRLFLEDVLRQAALPKGSPSSGQELDLCALSLASRLAFDIPDPWLYRTFGHLEKRLAPPHTLLAEPIQTASGPRLMAALLCNKAAGYILVGTLPPDSVNNQIAALRLRLFGLTMAMSSILFALIWRLRIGIIRPVHALVSGISAMENKQLDHLISLETRDEWEVIAGTFNEAIRGLEELEVARVIQQKLLPAKPIEGAGYTFSGRSIMSSQVGGDYFDARVDKNGDLAFLIGDVSGHGVAAALVTAMAKAAFGVCVREGVTKPEEILAYINTLFLTILNRAKTMTCLIGIARADGEIQFANAGHCYPYVISPDRKILVISGQGSFPLGIRPRQKYRSEVARVPAGGHLVLVSDGIPEAVDHGDEQFGYERLSELLVASYDPVSDTMITRVNEGLKKYTKDVPWQDDVTMALLTRSAQSPAN